MVNSFEEILVQRLGVCGHTYIAVRCLTGWILDIYISDYEKPKPPLETTNPYTMHLFFSVSIKNSNKDICN